MSEMSKIFCKRLLSAHILRNPSLKSFITTVPARKIVPPDQPSLSFTVQYLTNSCGLPLKSAVSASKKLQLDQKSVQKYDSVLSLLKVHGFSDNHIIILITKRPELIKCRIGKNLQPKMQFLLENGFSNSTLREIILSYPHILRGGLTNQIKRSFDFLKALLKTDQLLVSTIRRSSWLLKVDLSRIVQPNVDVLACRGVPASNICKLMIRNPRSFLVKQDRFASIADAVQNMGFNPSQMMFINAFRAMVQLSKSAWSRKLQFFKSLGWSDKNFLQAFKCYPVIMTYSEHTLKKNADFLMNTLKVEPSAMVSYPVILCYSIDRRIRPRYMVLRILNSKMILKENRKLAWVLALSEKNFLKKFVTKYLEEVPDLMDLYHGAIKAKTI